MKLPSVNGKSEIAEDEEEDKEVEEDDKVR